MKTHTKHFIESLKTSYLSQIQEAEGIFRLYVSDSVGVADHANIKQELDSALSKAVEAGEKLNMLEIFVQKLEKNE